MITQSGDSEASLETTSHDVGESADGQLVTGGPAAGWIADRRWSISSQLTQLTPDLLLAAQRGSDVPRGTFRTTPLPGQMAADGPSLHISVTYPGSRSGIPPGRDWAGVQ